MAKENKTRKLKVGEKYLAGSIGGKEGLKIALFPNRSKRTKNDPDYVGSINLALWINEKKEPKDPEL